jgi:hypothetical protein
MILQDPGDRARRQTNTGSPSNPVPKVAAQRCNGVFEQYRAQRKLQCTLRARVNQWPDIHSWFYLISIVKLIPRCR